MPTLFLLLILIVIIISFTILRETKREDMIERPPVENEDGWLCISTYTYETGDEETTIEYGIKITTDDGQLIKKYNSTEMSNYLRQLRASRAKGTAYPKQKLYISVLVRGFHDIESFDLPDGVEYVWPREFENCHSLTHVGIPNSAKLIGDFAFRDCLNLKDLTVPNSVTEIGKGTFNGCKSLTSVTLPASLTKIGAIAFENCTSLTSVTIPERVAEIGANCFRGCDRLRSITVDGDNPHFCSEDGVLYNKDKTVLICYPKGREEPAFSIPNTVTQIDESTFANCKNLTRITVPVSVTQIRSNAFNGCDQLQELYYTGTREQLKAIWTKDKQAAKMLKHAKCIDAE